MDGGPPERWRPAERAEPLDPMMSTLDLLEQVKNGDQQAVSLLIERSLPPLKRWARGRLPHWARSLADTHDVVQDALVKALPRLRAFEARHPGALQAYLRQAVANHIRDEIRKANRRPVAEMPTDQPSPEPSALQQAIGREGFERYEHALDRLRPGDREAIVARIELQQSYEEVAIALGKPSADAARVAVTRAIRKLVELMEEDSE